MGHRVAVGGQFHFCGCLKYLRSGGAWSFLAGIRKTTDLSTPRRHCSLVLTSAPRGPAARGLYALLLQSPQKARRGGRSPAIRDPRARALNAMLWDVDTAQHYDTPGSGMFAPGVLGPTVDRLAATDLIHSL